MVAVEFLQLIAYCQTHALPLIKQWRVNFIQQSLPLYA
jgi:hypothetical protein